MISLNGKIAVNSGKVMRSLKMCNGRINKVLKISRDHVWVCCFTSPLGDTQLGFAMINGTFLAVFSCLGAWLQLRNPSRLTPED